MALAGEFQAQVVSLYQSLQSSGDGVSKVGCLRRNNGEKLGAKRKIGFKSQNRQDFKHQNLTKIEIEDDLSLGSEKG